MPHFMTNASKINVCTTCETLALQTGTAMDYPNYLQSMITYSKNLRTSDARNNNRFERGGGNNGGNDDKKQKKDMTAFVPYKVYIKMSATEKAKREAAKKVAK